MVEDSKEQQELARAIDRLLERLDRVESDQAMSNEHDRIMFYEGGTQAIVAFEKCLPFLPEEIRQQVDKATKTARDVRGIEHRHPCETAFRDGWKQAMSTIFDSLQRLSVEAQNEVIEALRRRNELNR